MNPAQNALLAHPLYPRLKQFVLDRTGLNYYQDKDSDFAERTCRRLASLRIPDCSAYLERLEGPDGRRELDALVGELTIGETYFFRHSEQFDALRDIIIPAILKRNQPHRRLRIWSAGCATGAEPYSVSILLKTHFPHLDADWDVRILATDINRDFIARAQDARFADWAFRSTPDDLKYRCFSKSGSQWILAPEFRRCVSFQYHNLIQDPFPAESFDLILCRNVAIYFSLDECRKLVSRFEASLVEDGWLLVGHAEPNTEMFGAFQMLSLPGAILYRRGINRLEHANELPQPTVLENWVPPVLPALSEIKTASQPLPVPAPEASPAQADPSPAGDLSAIRRLADEGNWTRAAECCEALLKRDNLISAVHFYYALILEHLGRDAESEQALRRAVYLDRNSALAHYHLALRQQKNSDRRGASRSFENVLRLLSQVEPGHVFSDADGITAGELRELARSQAEALNKHA